MKAISWALAVTAACAAGHAQTPAAPLPDAPAVAPGQAQASAQGSPATREPCLARSLRATSPEAASAERVRSPCPPPLPPDRFARFANTDVPTPMTSRQKGRLALRDIIDPFNVLTIAANSGFTVGINSHSAYGPGFRGFGRSIGYSFSQDATGEVIGTYAVCSLLHEDPRYHRMPNGTPRQRLIHALSRTIIAQHDDGTLMPNYENFITYPASAELANLYVPGVHGGGPSTVARILTGLATDPVNNIITEFLPDFAKHVHIRVVFVQQILNQIASGQQF